MTRNARVSLTAKLLALVTALFAMIAMAVPASTAMATNTPVSGSTTMFNKYLVMDANANVPNATFTFSIKPASEQQLANGITSGVSKGAPMSASVTFTPKNDTTDGLPTDDNPQKPTSDLKYATGQVNIDLSSVSFADPGIYRYVITENDANVDGVSNDSDKTRYLDVYVSDKEGNGTLSIEQYLVSTVNTATKSTGFTNTYATNDLTLTKIVKGNQGNRDKKFSFTVTIAGATKGNTYTVFGTGITEGNSTLTANSEGAATGTYMLANNESITISGLTSSMTYAISENIDAAEGYKTSYAIDTSTLADETSFTAETMGNNNHTVTFTNAKEGIVPTGLLLEVAPYALLVVVIAGGLVALTLTSRKQRNR